MTVIDFYSHPDTQSENGARLGFGVWVAAAAGFVCVSVSLAVCVCCRKPKGFAEFRSSTQLAEISSAQPAEVTLFPPPSLLLNREDLEVSFEPLPRPQHQAVNTYRPKEVTEWIGELYYHILLDHLSDSLLTFILFSHYCRKWPWLVS